jgi:hypothetical protein
MSRARILINVDETSGTLDAILRPLATDPAPGIQRLAAYLEGIAGGVCNGSVRITTNCVKASQTGTFTDKPTANDTITINGVAFTAKNSGAAANEFNIANSGVAATDAINNATALAAAINASTSAKIVNQVTASSSGAVLTLTANIPGTNGNLFTVTEAMNNFTLAGTTFASGTEGTEVIMNHGITV